MQPVPPRCVVASATKLTAVIAMPFALLGAERRGGFLCGGFIGLVAITLVGNFAFGWHWLDAFALIDQSQGHATHLSIPTTATRLTGLAPDTTRVVAAALFVALVAYLLVWTYRGGDWLRAAAWATTGLLLATAWLLPWYLLWPLPAAAISRDRPLRVLLLALTAYQLGARIPL